MKKFKRAFVAACLATVCMSATMAQNESEKKIDLTEIGIDSATQSRLSDSTVVELARMAIEHRESEANAERHHEQQMEILRYQYRISTPREDINGLLSIVGAFSAVPILFIFIYMVLVHRNRRKLDKEKNEMLLKLVGSGQTLTPELVEAITHEKQKEKKAEELNMNTSLRRLFLGSGLIVFAIVFYCLANVGFDPFSPILALIGIFYAAQGLAGYLTLKQEREQQSESE